MKTTKSGLSFANFEKEINGKKTSLYKLENAQGTEVTILNYGARIVSLMVSDREGHFVDVVTGHNSIDEYLNSEEPYFGAICGRTANRIAKGTFTLEGKEYHLKINNGPNSLHGGLKGFNAVVWDAEQIDSHTVVLHYLSKDGEEGFPGNLSVTVKYTLNDDNSLELSYHATTDKTTILNLTNHSYFNLSGAGYSTIKDHVLSINADYYLPTDEVAIPYGAPEKVKGTAMDFTSPHAIGLNIDEKTDQLIWAKGYDHNYILNKSDLSKLIKAVDCYSPKSGIKLEVFTDQPGVQLYTGNSLTGDFLGKNGERYPAHSAVCFETQHYPDSIHHSDYPTTVLKTNEEFNSKTVFKFSIQE